MRYFVLFGLIALLSACGSKRNKSTPVVRTAAPQVQVPYATGPIQQACLAADRKRASQRLCGCIQAVANDRLSGSEQRKAARFFDDPHLAQEARQNGSRRFWTTYKSYANTAARVCANA